MHPRFASVAAGLALATLAASAAHARQVRVNVSSNAFTNLVSLTRTTNVNVGDHVVWVWTSGTHSVTAGDSLGPIPSGDFDTGLMAAGLGTSTLSTSFSVKFTSPGTTLYYCSLHAPGMAGRVIAGGTITGLSDFRITEVQFNLAGNLDLIELTNMADSPGDLALYRLKISGTAMQTIPALTAATKSFSVNPGAHVVVHLNASGTNTATDVFMPGVTAGLPSTGSLTLLVPNTVFTSVTSDQVLDYVEWGAAGQENEAVAASVNVWTAGSALTNVAAGHSIGLCGQGGQYGPAYWGEYATPSFGATNTDCTTPTERTTWGRIKSLYR